VVEQLRIAAGLPLSYRQEDVKINGWAIECRITAEDPYNNFLPSIGVVERVVAPNGIGVRLDSAVFDGYEISLFYDPMIAKLITYGKDRAEAITRMHRAIREFRIYGVRSSLPFFQQLLSSEPFLSGDFYTTSLETNPVLKPDLALAQPQPDLALIAAVLAEHFAQSGGVAKPNPLTPFPSKEGGNYGEEWKRTARRESLRRR